MLTDVKRQEDTEFVEILDSITDGELTPTAMKYLINLSRPLIPEELGVYYIPQLFAKNEECGFHKMLNDMEGEEFIYKATDNGKQDPKIRVPKVISLKVGASVMATLNVSDKLLNGMTGKIQCLSSDGFPVVALDNGTVQVVRPVFMVIIRQE